MKTRKTTTRAGGQQESSQMAMTCEDRKISVTATEISNTAIYDLIYRVSTHRFKNQSRCLTTPSCRVRFLLKVPICLAYILLAKLIPVTNCQRVGVHGGQVWDSTHVVL